MIKKSFCEEFIKKYSTTLRIAIALNLVKKYNISQFQASKMTGVPQPLLNYIINGKRRIPRLEKILKNAQMSSLVDELSTKLIKGEELDMCNVCIRVRDVLGISHPLTEKSETS
ncbi:MAG: helix-turn-helix transcriptional regulator [Ignisphaera sp.]